MKQTVFLSPETMSAALHNPPFPFSGHHRKPPSLHPTTTTTSTLSPPSPPPPLPSPSKPHHITPLQLHPLYTQTQTNLSHNFKEKILCLEIIGIDAGKALSLNPALRSATLDSIHSILTFLQSKGIHQKDLPRIIGMCPHILTSNIRTDLAPVFAFLSDELWVPETGFRRVINKCPRLLVCSVRDQLRPALVYLRRLGFMDMDSLAYNDPILLVSSVEGTLIPKLEFLVRLGFRKEDAIKMVLRCPSIFTFSVENNMRPKAEYFVKEMKGKLGELKWFPQYFGFSLENRIRPRHLEVLRSGVKVPLSVMLKATDEEFRELVMKGIREDETRRS